MRKLVLIFILIIFSFYPLFSEGALNFSQSFFKFSPNKPIKISSEILNITEPNKNFYIFDYLKNVIVIQENNRIYCDELILYYDRNIKKIKKIIIKGNIKIKSKDSICSCNYGEYYPDQKKIFLKGNIKILQDKNLFNGEELDIDLAKNIAVLKGKGKRINTIFGGAPK